MAQKHERIDVALRIKPTDIADLRSVVGYVGFNFRWEINEPNEFSFDKNHDSFRFDHIYDEE
jgi:hypothetical protein